MLFSTQFFSLAFIWRNLLVPHSAILQKVLLLTEASAVGRTYCIPTVFVRLLLPTAWQWAWHRQRAKFLPSLEHWQVDKRHARQWLPFLFKETTDVWGGTATARTATRWNTSIGRTIGGGRTSPTGATLSSFTRSGRWISIAIKDETLTQLSGTSRGQGDVLLWDGRWTKLWKKLQNRGQILPSPTRCWEHMPVMPFTSGRLWILHVPILSGKYMRSRTSVD